MTKSMLIDATQSEETRVAIVENGRLIDFDYESKVRRQLKGGIYLAKVTRVEPSLQAAFVDFGGNRHGFLPFSEIHPDYFRIPVADKEALLAAQQEELERHDEEMRKQDDDQSEEETNSDAGAAQEEEASKQEDNVDTIEPEAEEEAVVELGGEDQPADDDEINDDSEADDVDGNIAAEEEDVDGNKEPQEKSNNRRGRYRGRRRGRQGGRRRSQARAQRDEVMGGDGSDSSGPFRFHLRSKYKIQEVIKRGQIMLIQVSKEERGNKGAAVTSYLSLPGRYCVLMPNSPRGGGVSRKIAHYKDRKRMRDILSELTIPEGMSIILRTAGVSRTKAEIKRDLDYLTRLWNTIREETLVSSAPALIYEEGNLIKRSIRDLYGKDIEDIHVAGEEGYKSAKSFMKMLIPSHAKRVQEYKDKKIPLFHKYKVENQITEIGEPISRLKSGGYLVINPTEALVSIDVNSGKATKERHIEETALKTNLESAEEVARQMRLRDLGGLVVIDFIDMEDRRNNRKVENKLREALSSDRARIQMGRISSFGLLELSRQRLSPSLTETQLETCKHCQGTGKVRTLDFAALVAIRSLEDYGIYEAKTSSEVLLKVPEAVGLYILNNKRDVLRDIESRYGFKIHVQVDDTMGMSAFTIEPVKKLKDDGHQEDVGTEDAQEDDGNKGRRGRRRGRRGGRRRNTDRDNNSNQDQDVKEEKDSVEEEKEKKPKRQSRNKKENDQEKPEPKKRSTRSKKSEKETDKEASKAVEVDSSENTSSPSNDDAPKDYETVNEMPEKKKTGWWNKLID